MARMGTCKDYREAYRKICVWKDSLLMYTSPHGLHQSDAKLQILVDIFPDTPDARTRLHAKLGPVLAKRCTSSAVHLGCIHALQGETQQQSNAQLIKAGRCWHAMRYFWSDVSIPLRWRIEVFFAPRFSAQRLVAWKSVALPLNVATA